MCRDVELYAAGPQRVRNRAIASGQLCRLRKLKLAQPVRFHGDAELRALDHSHMVCDTEGGPCGCRDLPGAMTIAGERVSECHREASRVGRGRKSLRCRCAGPVAVASRPEQRQFAAGPVLEPQTSCSALEVAAPNDDRAPWSTAPEPGRSCAVDISITSVCWTAYGLSRAAADDHDRARRILGALLADGAEQQIGEAAVAAGADYQQVSFADGVDQHSSR